MQNNPSRPLYGGQAVIEGVMMRDRQHVAIAVRAPDGQIVVREDNLQGSLLTDSMRQMPVLRGVAALIDALGVGTRALLWSAQVSQGNLASKPTSPSDAANERAFAAGIATASIGLTAGLLFAGPAFVSGIIERLLGVKGRFAANAIEGAIRLALLVGYLTAVGQLPEGKRLFSYHGAEHKAINAYEAGAPLTPESVARFPLSHPRCGTAFMLTVAALNVAIGALFGRPPLFLRIVLRLLLLPVVAGIAYEAIQFSARNLDNPAIRAIIVPNLLFQRLTTREPDLSMLEVSICALERVLAK
ncbi:MAG: DUF1385 domain-containing protein [Aggregatilineales bacterium]